MAAVGSISGEPHLDAVHRCRIAASDAELGTPERARLVGGCYRVVIFLVVARNKRSGCSEFFSGAHSSCLSALLSPPVLHEIRSGFTAKGPHGHAIIVADCVLLWPERFRRNVPAIYLDASRDTGYGSCSRRYLNRGAGRRSCDAIRAAVLEFPSDCRLDGALVHFDSDFAPIHFSRPSRDTERGYR